MKTIVLIQCCKLKLPNRDKAANLYISPLFRLSLQYAYLLKPQAIHILSAKYGLLELNSIIDPYDETLLNMPFLKRRQWADKVLYDLKRKYDLSKDTFVFLAGIKYRQFLIPDLDNYLIPLKGLSIGKQLQALKRLCKYNRCQKGFWT